jgi:hypothetical protein
LHNNDLKISNGDFNICPNNKEALAQAIKIRLKTLYGEWFLDSSLGIPYLTEVFSQRISPNYLRHLITSELENIHDIKEIIDFDININSQRQANIKFKIILNNQEKIFFNEHIGAF